MGLLLVVRHGETDWNRDRRIQGHLDPPLNATGQDQARAMADALANELRAGRYARVPLVTSDLLRARQTAEALAALVGAQPRPTARLRERGFGLLEGKSWAELEALDPAAVRAYRDGDRDAVPGSEPWDGFRRRALSAAREIARRAPLAVVVTHGGVLKVLLEEALGEGKRLMIANAAVYRLRVHPDRIERVVEGLV